MSPSISIRIHGPIAGPDIHLKPRAKYYSLSFSPARLYRLIFALVNTLPLRSLVLHFRFLLILILGSVPPLVWAQQPIPGAPLRLDNATAADSSQPQSRDGWSTPYPNIHFTKGNRLTLHHPDTSIHLIHRHRFLQPALRNLGNHGSATRSLIFQPDMDAGPRLGYRLFDPYGFLLDSLPYYQTNRPYSVFRYELGSKQEQTAEILHTQNIDPAWNLALGYRKITSLGFYQIQRTNHDHAFLSSQYKSGNQKYEVKTGFVYNHYQQDENGGIVSDSFLSLAEYGERKSIPVVFQQDDFGSLGSHRRSPVSNKYRQAAWRWEHQYQFGPTDTVYNADSTQFQVQFNPVFGIGHQLEIQSEKQDFKDLRPDSLRYAPVFSHGFLPKGSDSLWRIQRALRIDNRVYIQGYLGREGQRMRIRAGLGFQLDRFSTEAGPQRYAEQMYSSPYLAGDIQREIQEGQNWIYGGQARFFLGGPATGNTELKLEGGRRWESLGTLQVGVTQTVSIAPYRAQEIHFSYFHRSESLKSEKRSQAYARLSLQPIKTSLVFRYHLLVDHLYLDGEGRYHQASPFSILQAGLQKNFYWRSLVLRNEILYQQNAGQGPVQLPPVWGRHQLSVERRLFQSPLRIASGVEFRYHSAFTPPGYLPLYMQYYYREGEKVDSWGEIAAFFNFQVKRFRAYIMADQMQRLLGQPNTAFAPGYPGTDLMIRFGFTWELVN